MRIVAGSAKGRPLKGPKPRSQHIRPTADRVRETLFNMLGQTLDGISVLDLYAGTGALGLESLSRGASRVVLVDSDREALSLCTANSQALGFGEQVEILPQTVERAALTLGRSQRRFELIFADPPYAARVVPSLLELVGGQKLLVPGGLFIIEHDKREEAPESLGAFQREQQKRFGDTEVSFFRMA